jgi:hypothetical protein
MPFDISSFLVGVASSLIATGIVFFLMRSLDKAGFLGQFFTPSKVTIAPELAKEPGKNTYFYRLFSKYMSAAKGEIWIIGEGPHDDDSLPEDELYERYRKSYAAVLQNSKHNVRIIRIQTTRDMKSKAWPRLLRSLLEDFSTQGSQAKFLLYFAATNAAYSAVIDPDDPHNNIAEMMLPTVIRNREVAGFGVFIHGRQWLARAVQDKMKNLISSAISFQELERVHLVLQDAFRVENSSSDSKSRYQTKRNIAQMIARVATVRIETTEEFDNYLNLFEHHQ